MKEPIIWEIGRRFEVVTNVRRADVQEHRGWVVLELSGEESALNEAITWVREKGIQVDLVPGDVIEG